MTLLAVAPALPLHSAGKYVAGAYIVFVLVLLIYLAIMAVRLGRTERALVELNHELARREEATPGAEDMPTPQPERDLSGAGRTPGSSPL